MKRERLKQKAGDGNLINGFLGKNVVMKLDNGLTVEGKLLGYSLEDKKTSCPFCSDFAAGLEEKRALSLALDIRSERAVQFNNRVYSDFTKRV